MTHNECLFCNIYNGKEPAHVIYKDEDVVIFKDLYPASENHFLLVPKTHILNAKHLTKEHIPLVENLVKHAQRIVLEYNGDICDARYD